jgi:hypothetical protein
MSRTIEAIMRHMASPAPQIIPHVNGTENLGKGRHSKKTALRVVGGEIRPHDVPFSLRRACCEQRQGSRWQKRSRPSLGPPEGTTVRIRAEGPDADKAMQAVEQMIHSRSDEDHLRNANEQKTL